MSNPFFDQPILNSPYEYPGKHWELDESGQPTQVIIEKRRRADFITPIPKPKKRKSAGEQQGFVFDEGKGLSTEAQHFAPTIILKAKDFATEITIFNARQHQMDSERDISSEHVTNNQAARKTLIERGIRPEQLPGYVKCGNFLNVVSKAKTACEVSEHAVSDHFADAGKTIAIPKCMKGTGLRRCQVDGRNLATWKADPNF